MTDDQSLPPRPRRRSLTPAGAVLGAVALAAAGFAGGVQVQKSRADGSTPATGRFAGFGQRGVTGAGQQQAAAGGRQVDATIGQVASVHGQTFYVSDQSGNKIKVKTNKQSKVTRSAVSDADAIHPGDTVIVQGSTAASGTVTASSVVATASNASGGFGGLFGGGGTGGPPAGLTPPSGG
jgi:hypothetical protein